MSHESRSFHSTEPLTSSPQTTQAMAPVLSVIIVTLHEHGDQEKTSDVIESQSYQNDLAEILSQTRMSIKMSADINRDFGNVRTSFAILSKLFPKISYFTANSVMFC